jgi:DnaJ-class molecular chaperone
VRGAHHLLPGGAGRGAGDPHHRRQGEIHPARGTQSGTTFRLKGKGIPSLNGRGRGDQYVTVYIETPRNLNKEQKDAMKKFAETLGENNYEERKKFFRKFKK